jgi:hypothetical protein
VCFGELSWYHRAHTGIIGQKYGALRSTAENVAERPLP